MDQFERSQWQMFQVKSFLHSAESAIPLRFSRTRGAGDFKEKVFPDHYVYSQQDISDLQDAARRCGAAGLLCTEKDFRKIHHFAVDNIPIYFVQISIRISDSEEFWRVVKAATVRNRAGSSR
jgi:tetraacyldisaccharide-1-P 4'-kinase